MFDIQAYAISGNAVSEQAEPSTANRAAGTINMRILIELQVIARILNEGLNLNLDLQQERQDVADEIS